MRFLSRFSFWFIVFSSAVMWIELAANPIKDIFFIDPLFHRLVMLIDPFLNVYEAVSYQLNIIGALLYILLYATYGALLDSGIQKAVKYWRRMA
ncbi:hypothetical protein [Indiicoccus explosivorum]|uniref:hypothetical protein n=1 Tax=Indiicoccus explosivorum TaxID=1917864 RepID=UPI000B431B6D|nr:hypothetical protein [Indiicoccus explosivorum]